MSRSWVYLRVVHILVDVVLLYGAFLLAYFLRVGFVFSTDFAFTPYAFISLFSVLIWSGFLVFTKYYRIPPRHGKRVLYDIALAFVGGAVAVGILIVTYFFLHELFFSRLLNIYVLLIGNGFLLLSHFLFRCILAGLKKAEKNIYRTLIIGANRVAEKLIQAIETNPYAPYKVIGVIDPYGLSKRIKGAHILGKLNKLESVCASENVTAIIQCDAFEHTMNMISFCDEKQIKYQFDPALRGIYEENLRIREVAGQMMISFVQRDFSGLKKTRFRFVDWVLRQVFDVD